MKKILLATLLATSQIAANAQQLAFPEAQGWGRFATGGRYGSVYHVTNLNDSGAGSLRDAVTTKNRIVVFDVSGVIKLNSRLVFASNLYVAGQSAPGEGITVYGNGVSFSGATNSIIRYMRFRMGVGGDSGKDCAGVANGTNMIFDHCSFAWGRDETFSINPDGKGDLHSITIQNCVVGQGLMSHSAGGLIQADKISLYRNFYCDNSTRNNKVKGTNQYVNNIVYNWKDGAYIMGGDSEGQSYCNIVGNLFINGPMGGGNAFSVGNTNFHCYVKDNIQDNGTPGVFDPKAVTNFAGSDVVATPYDYPALETISASSLLDNLKTVGASYPFRDYVDCYMVDEAMSFGKDGAFLSNEASLPFGIPSSWKVWTGTKLTDSDKDGIPDIYETQLGTDPNKNDAMTLRSDGYTNIEHYLNSLPTLAAEITHLRAPMLVEMASRTTNSMQITWRDWTEGEEGFRIEMKTGTSAWTTIADVASGTTSALLKDLQPGTAYDIRIAAYKGDLTSDYSDVMTFKTRPLETNLVDVDSYTADAEWTGKGSLWTTDADAWNTTDGLFRDGMNVLFREGTVAVNEDVAPECVVANVEAEKTVDISGLGSITGATSVNKTGAGTLVLKNSNSYTGATVCHEGVIEFSSLKDGGVKSAIGASQEFAQNWIFNGGEYIYTGANTTTNRSAKLMDESKLSVKNSTATITMNGTFEGASNLRIGGKGTIQVNTKNFFGYTGATILEGGTVYLPNADISNNGIGSSSKLIFAGGTLKTKGETEGYETYSFPIEVREGTTSVFAPNRNCYIKNNFSGKGTLQIDIPYVREYIQGNFDSFRGRIIANALSNGNLFLISGKNIPNAVVELKNGARFCGWDTAGNYTIGGLSGAAGTQLCGSSKQTNNFTCSWTIGGANTDETFRGVINNYSCSGSGHQGTVNITKTGTGVWRLTGANEYKGTTTVNGGTLVINGAHTGTGAITVNSKATLAGSGSVASAVSVKAGGTILAGDTLVANRTFTLKGKLTVAKGGSIRIPITVSGTTIRSNYLTLSAGLALTSASLVIDNGDEDTELDLPEGTEIRVYKVTGTPTGSFADIQPARPGVDKVWDTTDLVKTGILRVKADESVSIKSIDALDSHDTVYDLKGRKLTAGNVKPGLYVVNGKKVQIK